MKGLRTIGQAILYVSDMGRAVTFYRDEVGLPLKYPQESADWAQEFWVVFDVGGFELALHHGATKKSKDAPALKFYVDDLDVAHADLVERGVVVEPIVEPHPGVRHFHFLDPDGQVWFVSA
ncbi:MAG: VOC family protein [Armatimonadetes bacterium]|nr:VOC family protein [Armatimonadota bacterium]